MMVQFTRLMEVLEGQVPLEQTEHSVLEVEAEVLEVSVVVLVSGASVAQAVPQVAEEAVAEEDILLQEVQAE
jgi:hypothetical protein